MKPFADTQATGQRQQRPAVSILPAGYFARIGGADLSPAERQLVEDFRQMNASSRRYAVKLSSRMAASDRAARIANMAPRLQLVKGGEA